MGGGALGVAPDAEPYEHPRAGVAQPAGLGAGDVHVNIAKAAVGEVAIALAGVIPTQATHSPPHTHTRTFRKSCVWTRRRGGMASESMRQ